MTRKELHKKIRELVQNTRVHTTEEAWIDFDDAVDTTNAIIKFLGTVYDLEELVH